MSLQTRNLRSIIICTLLLSFAALSSAAPQKPEATPKPKVRAITAFINLERDRYQIQISDAVQFLKYARTVFESRGYTVQTLRIATQPFPEYTKSLSRDEALQFFKNLDGLVQQDHLILSIGPAYLSGDDGDAQANLLAEIIQNTKSINGTVFVTNDAGVNWPAVKAAVGVIKKLADSTSQRRQLPFRRSRQRSALLTILPRRLSHRQRPSVHHRPGIRQHRQRSL